MGSITPPGKITLALAESVIVPLRSPGPVEKPHYAAVDGLDTCIFDGHLRVGVVFLSEMNGVNAWDDEAGLGLSGTSFCPFTFQPHLMDNVLRIHDVEGGESDEGEGQ